MNPQIPCTLVVDHSVTADVCSRPDAAAVNARLEAERNAERFAFLKWSSESFENVRIVPPGRGICHQLNIEHFCRVVWTDREGEAPLAYFDTLVGTDSHTTTANGMGVLGWGVGGIEAEAAALGQPISMMVPPVVGIRLIGAPAPGVSAMDVALAFAERLRAVGVVGALVECFGPGVAELSATQRATIANMTPEYGCTATFFPPDERALAQLNAFGRDPSEARLARAYLAAQGIAGGEAEVAVFCRVIEIDLSAVEPSLAGPSRPHDRVGIGGLQARFRAALADHGRAPGEAEPVELGGREVALAHGAVAIAAVTSCTTATDPAMMVACGLAARRAVELGCAVPPWVKRVLAPGSHATCDLLEAGGLLGALAELGFSVCGWGCMSCIGNSGPLDPAIEAASDRVELVSVLSGNRNFEGRISPFVSQNYLCAPALVIAYAIAGTVDVDLAHEPVCRTARGPVMLADILPSDDEVARYLEDHLTPALYRRSAAGLFEGGAAWEAAGPAPSSTYAWDPRSTYVRRPPFLDEAPRRRSGASRVPAPWRSWAISSPPTTSRLPAPSRRVRPRRATWRSGRRSSRFQLLRRPQGQPRGHGARHLREPAASQPPGSARPVDGRSTRWAGRRRPSSTPRRARARRGSPRGGGRQDVRERLIARLGSQGSGASGGARGARRELRAHPIAPTWWGWASCRCSSRRERRPPLSASRVARPSISAPSTSRARAAPRCAARSRRAAARSALVLLPCSFAWTRPRRPRTWRAVVSCPMY